MKINTKQYKFFTALLSLIILFEVVYLVNLYNNYTIEGIKIPKEFVKNNFKNEIEILICEDDWLLNCFIFTKINGNTNIPKVLEGINKNG